MISGAGLCATRLGVYLTKQCQVGNEGQPRWACLGKSNETALRIVAHRVGVLRGSSAKPRLN